MQQSIILRAEIRANSRAVIGHTTDCSTDSLYFVTEEQIDVGTQVEVTLSFPGLLAPFRVEAEVGALREAGEPGEPAGWVLSVSPTDDAGRDALARTVEAVTREHDTEFAADQPYRVLLVEDSRLTRQVFTHSFSKAGPQLIQVDSASDVASACELARDHEYDLAIIDYFLPDGRGDGLMEKLRAEPKNSGLPVVAVSVGGTEAKASMMGAGASIFLQKPVAVRDLLSTVTQLRKGSTHVAQ